MSPACSSLKFDLTRLPQFCHLLRRKMLRHKILSRQRNSQFVRSAKNHRHATLKIFGRRRRGYKPFERRRPPRIFRSCGFSASQTPEKIYKEKQLGRNRRDRRNANDSAQTVNPHHRSWRKIPLKQPDPMHRHEKYVHSAKCQPKMDFAERLVQPPPKHFREPEEECRKNRERCCNSHHQVKMPCDKCVARAAPGKFAPRQKYSRESSRQKERNKSQHKQHRRREARLCIPERAEPTHH